MFHHMLILVLFFCWLCGSITTVAVSERKLLEIMAARTSFSSKRKKESSMKKSLRTVLRSNVKFAAKYFDDNVFSSHEIFPHVGVARSETMDECLLVPPEASESFDWTEFLAVHSDLVAKRGSPQKISEEMLQEVGFIEMFRNHYPRSFFVDIDGHERNYTLKTVTVNKLNSLSPPPLVFLPMCGYLDEGTDRHPFGKSLNSAKNVVDRLQKEIHPKRIFYVAPHPLCHPDNFLSLIYNTRRLHTDQTVHGSYGDIVIPVSTTPSVCHRNFQYAKRNNLIYSCGSEHSIRFEGLRSGLSFLFNSLNKTDIDMSTSRKPVDYRTGFWRSKFCFVVPGDTASTSQASRAMCAGCVPIFISHDFRDLPFSNVLDYDSFSVRLHPSHFFSGLDHESNKERALCFYNSLREMIKNGTYHRLSTNVRLASGFFDYSSFGSYSPYGASLLSIYQDFRDELQ